MEAIATKMNRKELQDLMKLNGGNNFCVTEFKSGDSLMHTFDSNLEEKLLSKPEFKLVEISDKEKIEIQTSGLWKAWGNIKLSPFL